jgi:hypothetical protein
VQAVPVVVPQELAVARRGRVAWLALAASQADQLVVLLEVAVQQGQVALAAQVVAQRVQPVAWPVAAVEQQVLAVEPQGPAAQLDQAVAR